MNLMGKLDDMLNSIHSMLLLYDEYMPDILTVKDVDMSVKKLQASVLLCWIKWSMR